MKTRNKFYLILFVVAAFSLSACSKFLDEMPDNRTELDNEDKVLAMLVSAYPTTGYPKLTEFYSDNTDELAYLVNPTFEPVIEQIYNWQDVNQTDNEDPAHVWSSLYGAIAAANQALNGIEEMGGATTIKLKAAKGEALVARAYAHFMLVNIFCHAYNPQYAESDLGVPYMEKAETELKPHYERGTVAEVYTKIAQDLADGLPLINETVYTVPKYHFNNKAAYAFAARFYLFYQQWEKAIECANKVLGSNPASLMRDMAYLSSLPEMDATDASVHAIEYTNAARKCNLLMMTSYSSLGLDFSWWVSNIRYNHGKLINTTENFGAKKPWTGGSWYEPPYVLANANYDKTCAQRYPKMFEITDAVAQTGYRRTVFPALTIEETILIRAEANIMLKQYVPALDDMTLWVKSNVRGLANGFALSETMINNWANSINYYTAFAPTPKKAFDAPAFEIAMGSTQENLCHALLYMRRIETLHMGLRLFDVKRYGITMYRRQLANVSTVGTITSIMRPRDPRCAIQLPDEVLGAGLTPNPR